MKKGKRGKSQRIRFTYGSPGNYEVRGFTSPYKPGLCGPKRLKHRPRFLMVESTICPVGGLDMSFVVGASVEEAVGNIMATWAEAEDLEMRLEGYDGLRQEFMLFDLVSRKAYTVRYSC